MLSLTFAERVNHNCTHHTSKKRKICEVMDVLINLMFGSLSKCVLKYIKILTLYTLNTLQFCQLHLNKVVKMCLWEKQLSFFSNWFSLFLIYRQWWDAKCFNKLIPRNWEFLLKIWKRANKLYMLLWVYDSRYIFLKNKPLSK